MVSNTHYIELFINKELVELESQESLNLRINNVLFNPTKTTTTQVEYSYSFDIPSTPNNDRILGYANNLSRIDKFHARYAAEVYADDSLIFNGSLTVQKYNGRTKMYTCNLVNIKINTVEDIFGDAVMTDIGYGMDNNEDEKGHWHVPFSGAPTINEVNEDMETKYFFPFVCYGVFQKNYITQDDVSAEYTSKFTLDKYNKWWVETFYPSLNMLEAMKKAFEWKGYTVGGNAFADPNISNIFMSTNLSEEQVPIYNLGNPKFGVVNITTTWNNLDSVYTKTNFTGRRKISSTGGLQQDLKFPYYSMKPWIRASNRDTVGEQWNFDTIEFWNMCDTVNNKSGVTVTLNQPSYMYDPNECVVVIPADGWYKIYLSCSATLNGAGSSFSAEQWTNTFRNEDPMEEREVTIKRGLKELTPLEIQLVRNYDDNIELIKGKKNVTYDTGDPSQETYDYRGGSWTGASGLPNRHEWLTEFPHQELFGSIAPTKTEDIVVSTTSDRRTGRSATYTSGSGNFGGANVTRGGTIDPTGGGRASGGVIISTGNRNGNSDSNTYGYMHKDGYVMPYDQAVSTAFICGFSTYGDGTVSVMRNGQSWSKTSSVVNRIFAEVRGLDLHDKDESGGTVVTNTNYCRNEYKNSENNIIVSDAAMSGVVTCCVYLNRNDILELMAVQRDYDGQKYGCSATCNLVITAMSDKTYDTLKADSTWNYYSPTDFPTKLNLFNFTNNEKKVSDWINDVNKAFNLEITQNGTDINIDVNKGIRKNVTYAVDVDDRFNSYNATSEFISYPLSMAVKYSINTDEWGFEKTVPLEHINDDDWKNWGDSGFTVIQLNDDSYETTNQVTQTNFSYTYYDSFLWKEVSANGTESESGVSITIPVIEEAQYMADGYGYEEAMKHDGYSLTQRFWYRTEPSEQYVYLSDNMHEQVFLTYTKNQRKRFNLSYKDSETSIVSEYFNIHPMLASNYATIDVYLTPSEYFLIKGGALVHFDSDLYYTSEIKGFDPSGGNTTELKLIKKI